MTSDGEALFRAVCESPADDTPRLVYADWLEENGRPERAEFIRAQVALARGTLVEADRSALLARTERALAAHRLEWLREVPHLLGVQWDGTFRRGFLEAALLVGAGCFLQAADVLFATAPVCRLTLQGLDTAALGPVLGSGYLRRLIVLRLPGNRLDNRGAELLAGCRSLARLENLDLAYNGITDAGVRALLDSPCLRNLSVLNVAKNPTREWDQDRVNAVVSSRAAQASE